MSRQRIIDIAASQNGEKESPPNSNKNKFGAWYGWNGYAWCAMYVSWVYDQAGHPLGHIDDDKGFRDCNSGYRFWKNSGELTSSPQMGDIVLFSWNGDGKCNHVGIFLKWVVEGKTFQSWEGNTAVGNDSDGGQVMLRNRNATSVRAFVSPKVLGVTAPIPVSESLKKGDRGAAVAEFQKLLYDLEYEITVDGYFGPQTEKTVKKFQSDFGLNATGVVSPVDLGVMETEVNKPKVPDTKLTTGAYYKKGAIGEVVLAIQKALNKNGANPLVDEDGVFGNQSVEAVKAFQKKKKVTVDGIVGPETLALLGVKVG
jgi:peptidoglycan hydrolase-like protein with peptidoglycan-binding domain